MAELNEKMQVARLTKSSRLGKSLVGRRTFIRNMVALSLLPSLTWAASNRKKKPRYKIAVIDLMILKRQKLSALPLAKEIGADGLEVDMGGLGTRETFDNKLADPEVRKQYIEKLKELNLEICSLAMTGFYAQSFAKREGVEKMVSDCITTMQQLNVQVAFLPLGVQGDLVKNPELRPLIVERLKMIAPLAEKAGVTIGIETALNATEEVKLLKEVGSKAIQIYFNFSNALEGGRDVCEELKILGKDRICQIHCTDKDGVWLENNTRLDMKKVKSTLDKIGWKGWLVIERSRDANKPQDVRGNFGANTAYMKSIFQPV
ncbi:sugar phosphate isomerase/epimerase family protein [Dyadobacter pollutisoli]|uniref:Sugar phosphate isomerase/epimerase n=1 Tax=Dyadobacter pollutisoli TaxID=2910158 RepID=A0A9E8NH58_9BACT|nr:sugar phosphate isomerase/epimerase family protein [Dyadobacter pollutisoli]WAC13959.1 sugar phosphate isomerase/epimerase [Dyadobacter pollutisoli]